MHETENYRAEVGETDMRHKADERVFSEEQHAVNFRPVVPVEQRKDRQRRDDCKQHEDAKREVEFVVEVEVKGHVELLETIGSDLRNVGFVERDDSDDHTSLPHHLLPQIPNQWKSTRQDEKYQIQKFERSK